MKIPLKSLNKIIAIQVIIFISIVIYISIKAVPRWDLLDQVAMADRVHLGLNFYPPTKGELLGGVSVYFPGLAMLAAFLMEWIPSNAIILVMLFIASFITIYFIFFQKKITRALKPDYNHQNFWPVMIIFSGFICKDWLYYSAEFKPDTIAYLIGALCIYTHHKSIFFQENKIASFLLGIIVGACLIFKQQYLAFIAGYLLYVIYTRHSSEIALSLGMLFTASVAFSLVFGSNRIWFWNIQVLSDDGYLTLSQWIKSQLAFGLHFFICLVSVILIRYFKISHVAVYNMIYALKHSWSKPWLWLMIISAAGAFLSSWKIGGNSGNTAYGLILFSPLVLLVFEKTNRLLIIAIAFIVLIDLGISASKVGYNLSSVSALKTAVEALPNEGCKNIVVGSNLYFSIREKYKGCTYNNYWSKVLANNSDISKGKDLKTLVNDKRNKIFIVENFFNNESIIKSGIDLHIVFKNKLGLVAIRK